MDRRVNSYFGISLNEFLAYPPDICDHILELCKDKQIEELKTQKDVLSSMDYDKK